MGLSNAYMPMLHTSGVVAGIRNHGAVKCLHAHAAHFWSGCKDNVVSEEVTALLNEQAQRADSLASNPSSNANE